MCVAEYFSDATRSNFLPWGIYIHTYIHIHKSFFYLQADKTRVKMKPHKSIVTAFYPNYPTRSKTACLLYHTAHLQFSLLKGSKSFTQALNVLRGLLLNIMVVDSKYENIVCYFCFIHEFD